MAPAIANLVIPNSTEGITCFCTITNVIESTQVVRVHHIATICIIEYLHIIFIINRIAYHEGPIMAISMLWNAHPMTILVRTNDVLLQAYAPVPIVFATFIGNRVLLKIIATTHNTKLSLNAFFRFRCDYVDHTTDGTRTI